MRSHIKHCSTVLSNGRRRRNSTLRVTAAAIVISGAFVASAMTADAILARPHVVMPHTGAAALNFTVNTGQDTVDSAPGNGICRDAFSKCSLRAAITEGNSLNRAVIITIGAGNFVLTVGPLTITDRAGVTINGAGSAKTTINATGTSDRVLVIDGNGSNAIVSGVSIVGGTAPASGSNQNRGGGVLINNGSNALVLNAVVVKLNHATQYGGGIYNDGSLWLNNSTVISNSSIDSTYGLGGGIYNSGNYVSLISSTIANNSASHQGGGFYTGGPTEIVGGSISNNTLKANSGKLFGAGLYVDEQTTIVGTLFKGNTAGPDSAPVNVSAYGAGIYSYYGLGSLTNVTVQNNSVTATGTGDAFGGGFDAGDGATTVKGSKFLGNIATSQGSGASNGGGIAIGDTGNNYSAFLSISSSSVSGNIAASTGTGKARGGGIYLVDPTTGNGGGSLQLTGSVVSSNQANNPVGMISSQVGGGGIFDGSCGSGAIIDSTTITGNTAHNSQGGGVYNASCNEVISNSRIISNHATGFAGTSSYSAEGVGGGLSLYDTTTVTNTWIQGNTSDQMGGGVYSDDGQILRGVTIVGNHSKQGAGVYSAYGVALISSAVVDNVGTGGSSQGGGLYLSSSQPIVLSESTVAANVAMSGAGIYSDQVGGASRSSLIAGNHTPAGVENNCVFVTSFSLGSAGGNRVGDSSCQLLTPTDRQGKTESGYTVVAPNGRAFNFNTPNVGSALGKITTATGQVVATAGTPDGKGSWMVTSHGVVFASGTAVNYGSAGGKIISAMAGTPDGKGYWLVASNGIVYAFGSAANFGSAAGKSIVGIAATPDGRGYWLVASNGVVYHFGSAITLGSAGGQPIRSIAAAPDGQGYWLASANGNVFSFGTAKAHGTALGKAIVAIAAAPDGKGYWLLSSTGAVYNFGTAAAKGSLATLHVSSPTVGFFAL